MKKMFMLFLTLLIVLTGCSGISNLTGNHSSSESVNYTLGIPQDFIVKNVSPTKNVFYKGDVEAGGYEVITVEERDSLLKGYKENTVEPYFDDVPKLYFPTKRAVLSKDDKSGLSEIHYFLENKEHNNVYHVYFYMPYFDYKNTLLHMKTFGPAEQS